MSALATSVLGLVLFFANIASNPLAIIPCLFMATSGFLIFLTRFIPNKSVGVTNFLFYSLLICLLIASAVTSFLPSNSSYPATTFVAFTALLPLLIEDAPIKMASLEIGSGITYLSFSALIKNHAAFRLDITNTITFVVIGIFLYIVVMRRTASEIWQTMRGKELQDSVVTAIGTVIEAKDGITGEHVFHTQKIVRLIIDESKKTALYKGLPEEYFENVCRAAALHDIGKMKIPDEILNKHGKLTPEEYEIVKKHVSYGSEIISKMQDIDNKAFLSVAYNIVRYHHEKWDGTGYPEGLKEDAIPLEARIMAIADVYDALISQRQYKDALPEKEAIEIIKNGKGSHFDPNIVDLFLNVVSDKSR